MTFGTILKKKGVYLTGKRIATLFREAAKWIHPNTLKDELLWYSAHSLQLRAGVLLDKAGMSPKFIILGFLLQMYLLDTGVTAKRHKDILQAALQEVLDLIAGPSSGR